MLFNISLPDLSDTSGKLNIEVIRRYLATLNDQLRYMMLNIDEDNLSDDLLRTIKTAYLLTTQWRLGEYLNGQLVCNETISSDKLAVDGNGRTDLTSNPGGVSLSNKLDIIGENGSCTLSVNELGNLLVTQHNNSIPFSLVLTKEDDCYTLSLFDSNGDMIGNLPIQIHT